MEGTRPMLIEIQALVCDSNFNIPRRQTTGADFNRVNLLMAVLEKDWGFAWDRPMHMSIWPVVCGS